MADREMKYNFKIISVSKKTIPSGILKTEKQPEFWFDELSFFVLVT